MTTNTPHGILLFAHGARDPAWALPFEQARAHVEKLQASSGAVALAFLEFMSPTLLEAGNTLVQQGCQHISVIPMFLGAGGHVRKDLPALMAQLAETHPHVTWTLTPAIGQIPSVIEAMAQSAWQLSQNPKPKDVRS